MQSFSLFIELLISFHLILYFNNEILFFLSLVIKSYISPLKYWIFPVIFRKFKTKRFATECKSYPTEYLEPFHIFFSNTIEFLL